jgi:tetratricopeptide (TPR) repeat protein
MSMLLADDPRFHPVMRLIDNAQYIEAIRQLDVLSNGLKPKERAVALYWKVRCWSSLSEVEKARVSLEEALALVDEHDPLRICLKLESALLLRTEKGPDKAALEIRFLLDSYAEELKTPDFFWVYVQAKTDLGNCLVLAGHYAESIKELEEALSLQDQPLSRYYIYFWLGVAHHQLSEIERAKDDFENAVNEAQFTPEQGVFSYYPARIQYELALISYKQHRYNDAARHLESASLASIQDSELSRVIERLKTMLAQRAPHLPQRETDN